MLTKCKCGCAAEYERKDLEDLIKWGIGCTDQNCANHEPKTYYTTVEEAEFRWEINS